MQYIVWIFLWSVSDNLLFYENYASYSIYALSNFSCMRFFKIIKTGIFLGFFMYFIQHYFICRPSESTVSEDAGIEPKIIRVLSSNLRYIAFLPFNILWK